MPARLAGYLVSIWLLLVLRAEEAGTARSFGGVLDILGSGVRLKAILLIANLQGAFVTPVSFRLQGDVLDMPAVAGLLLIARVATYMIK